MNYLETLCHLKIASFKNAVRLFCDACIIYHNKSYATALALAILSLEEIGKYEMAEHLMVMLSLIQKSPRRISLIPYLNVACFEIIRTNKFGLVVIHGLIQIVKD
jgi:hypothetical protein